MAEDIPDWDAWRKAFEEWQQAMKQVKAAFALPGVQQEILEQEAAEVCDGLDKWLAALEEEKANG
jgi:hypothetical protein